MIIYPLFRNPFRKEEHLRLAFSHFASGLTGLGSACAPQEGFSDGVSNDPSTSILHSPSPLEAQETPRILGTALENNLVLSCLGYQNHECSVMFELLSFRLTWQAKPTVDH